MALKIGFVGTGGIARAHMDALGKIPEAQVVACADIDPDRAAVAAARFAGAGAYTSHNEMLDAQELDAVYICVPPHAHGDIELALIARRIPFFVEKPLGNDRETPRRVMAALEGTDLITSVGYVFRYRQNAQRAKERLQDDAPVVARGTYVGGMPRVAWWRRKEQSGGQLNEQSTHLVDLVRHLFGEVTSVFCAGRRGLVAEAEGSSVEDASICTLVFESGLICEITSSCAVQQGEVSLEIFTRAGRVALRGVPLNLTVSHAGQTHSYESTDDALLRENQAFVRAVLGGDPSEIKSPYADAFRTQMVTCAADESMDCGRLVKP